MNQKYTDAMNEMFRRMYAEAEPSASWDEIVANPPEDKRWFANHYLPLERQDEIRDEIAKEFKLTKAERWAEPWDWLAYSPSSVKKVE